MSSIAVNQSPELQSAVAALSLRQALRVTRKALSRNLPFFFREDGARWRWQGARSQMMAVVEFNRRESLVFVTIIDAMVGEEIMAWRSEVNLLDADWRHQLRCSSGAAIVLAQARPRCPRCGQPMKLQRRQADDAQIFACWNAPACPGTREIGAHGVARDARQQTEEKSVEVQEKC